MTGSSHKIIGGLAAHKPDVALISEELQDGLQVGVKVLLQLQSFHHIPAVMLLQSPNPFGSIMKLISIVREEA